MAKLDEECIDAEKSFGYIYRDLQSLIRMMDKVIDYFNTKVDPLGKKHLHASDAQDNKGLPLFLTMQEPSEELVGHLIDLKCGHT